MYDVKNDSIQEFEFGSASAASNEEGYMEVQEPACPYQSEVIEEEYFNDFIEEY